MRRQLDLLVPPLGRAVDAGDQSRAVDPPEVAVGECIPRLCLLARSLGQAEVPARVLLPAV